MLDFNAGAGCPINIPVFDEVEITNTLTKKVKFKFDPVHPSSCELQFSPASGTLDKVTNHFIPVSDLIVILTLTTEKEQKGSSETGYQRAS